ncbi:MAG: VWA domain-containing protein [Deltaproteobacteria bacterium]|nr:VWA domain-containing protein [Deltaproteobacteria bacterium]
MVLASAWATMFATAFATAFATGVTGCSGDVAGPMSSPSVGASADGDAGFAGSDGPSSPGSNGSDAGTDGLNDRGRADLGVVGSACDRTEDCSSGLECLPGPGVCLPAGSVLCSGDDLDAGAGGSTCGRGAFCSDDGVCQANRLGGPCHIDEHCLSGEQCLVDHCVAAGSPGTACVRAEQCQSPMICDPVSSVCAAGITCSDASGCGMGGICDGTGQCAPNVSGGPCEEDGNCIEGEACVGHACVNGCGGAFFQAERVAPNVMIVVDRSASMTLQIGNESKWNIARNAALKLLSDHGDDIRFGLSLFPGNDLRCTRGDNCSPGLVSVPIDDNNAWNISQFLRDAYVCNLGTPLAEALYGLVGSAGLRDPNRPNYVVVLTDGQASCGEPVPAVEALRAQDPEVRTFVVGFGTSVDPQELSAMANAGGTAQPGGVAYYQADDADALSAAFASIAGNVLSCDYTLSEVPPDPDLLYIYFGGTPVPRNLMHTDGWDHEATYNRLTFYGAACDALRSGSVSELTIVYGCPLPPDNGLDAGVGDGAADGGGGATDGGVSDGGVSDGGPDPGTHDDGSTGIECSACGACPDRQACIINPGATTGVCGDCTTSDQCCAGEFCLDGACWQQP